MSQAPIEFQQSSDDADVRGRRVLVVDDDADSRAALERVLRACGYEVETAADGMEGLAKLPLEFDLILLDGEMPGLDGFSVARRIRDNPDTSDLPIIMVTGLESREDRLRAIEIGVNDFLTKPFDVTEIRLRSQWLVRLKLLRDQLRKERAQLEQAVERRTVALRKALEDTAAAQRLTYQAHLDTIRRLVLAAEYKDHDTASHIERIGLYSEILARGLGLAPGEIELMRHATPMHDVGKLGIPDAILIKPGKLTPEEWEVMKAHTMIGARILQGSPSKLLQLGETVALSHHERWDGTGYPHGIAEGEIPLGGRICAVADVFDALTTNRHYRDALPNETVFDMMRSQRGAHFDPKIVDVFFENLAAIEEVQREHASG